MSNDLRKITVVLVGKTGNGRSSTGNTLLGQNKFETKVSTKGVTENIRNECCRIRADKCNVDMEVVDTPGMFDCGKFEKNALKLFQVEEKKPHVFLLVLQAGRFTDEEQLTIDLLIILFGESVIQHTIIIVTRGDQFENDEQFNQFLKESEHVKKLVELCGQRVMKIENKTKHFDFSKFLRFTDNITQNGTLVFTNKNSKTHKSIVETYFQQNNEKKSFVTQLQEMSKELGQRLSNWKVPLLIGGVAGVALGGGVCLARVAGPGAVIAAGQAAASSLSSAANYVGTLAMQHMATAAAGASTIAQTVWQVLILRC